MRHRVGTTDRVEPLLAQLLEPPRYGPVCQVVWRGVEPRGSPLSRSTVAFTPAGMEYLQEMLAEYKRNRSSPRS